MILDIMIYSLYIGLVVVYMISTEKMLHIMQLEGYKPKDYTNWLSKNYKNAFKPRT